MRISIFILVILSFMVFFCQCIDENPVDPGKEESEWINANKGLNSLTIEDITFVPSNKNVLYVATLQGLYKSENGALNWREHSSGLSSTYIYCLAIHPNNESMIFCGTKSSGVHRSKNGGDMWEKIWDDQLRPQVLKIAVAKNNTLWAGTMTRLYKSEDLGESWQEVDGMYKRVMAIGVSPQNPETIYVSHQYRGNFRSTDNGLTWKSVDEGIYYHNQYGADPAIQFVFDSGNPDHVYMASARGDIYKTTNGGDNWEKCSNNLEWKKIISVDINGKNNNELWAATENDGVYFSSNGGKHWESFNNGLEAPVLTTIRAGTNDKTVLYLGTQGMGIFKYVY